MSDYIRREEVVCKIERLRDKCGNDEMAFALNWAKELVIKIPAADVRPVVREKWLAAEYCHGAEGYEEGWFERRAIAGDAAYCSKCGEFARLDEAGAYVLSNFCPNCGADMREEKE